MTQQKSFLDALSEAYTTQGQKDTIKSAQKMVIARNKMYANLYAWLDLLIVLAGIVAIAGLSWCMTALVIGWPA